MKTRTRRPKPLRPGMPESRVMMGVVQAARFFDVELDRQNTGAMKNESGRLVRFGVKGNSDLTGMTGPTWGRLAGLKVDVECKKEHWKPPRPPKPGRLPGKLRLRWEAQLDRLRRTNANGGFGFWTDDPEHAFEVFRLLKEGGHRIEIGEDEEVWLVPISRAPKGAPGRTEITLDEVEG